MNRDVLIVIAIVGIAVVGFGAIAIDSVTDQCVDRSDAEEVLASLGYDGARIDTCSYEEMAGCEIAYLTGEFSFWGNCVDYKFTFNGDGDLIYATVDGKCVPNTGHGVCLYDWYILGNMYKFRYDCENVPGYGKGVCEADYGMTFVAVKVIIENLSCDRLDTSKLTCRFFDPVEIYCCETESMLFSDGPLGPNEILAEGEKCEFIYIYEFFDEYKNGRMDMVVKTSEFDETVYQSESLRHDDPDYYYPPIPY